MATSSHKDQLIYGIHNINEALEAGQEFEQLYLLRKSDHGALKEIHAKARSLSIPVQRVPVEKLNRLTRKKHQGVAGFLSLISYANLDNVVTEAFARAQDPLIIILDGVSDVRNLGAIARSAEVMGAHGLVVPFSGSARLNQDAMKASAGALHHLPVCRHLNLQRTCRSLQAQGIRTVALSEQASNLLTEVDLSGPIALIMGDEGSGIQAELLKEADVLAAIPQQGKISSLNVSVAAAIALYEVIRQRQVK